MKKKNTYSLYLSFSPLSFQIFQSDSLLGYFLLPAQPLKIENISIDYSNLSYLTIAKIKSKEDIHPNLLSPP